MSRVTFEGKLLGETITLSFDFKSRLAAGETISSSGVSATVYSGNDSTPSAILSGSSSVSGSVVSQTIAAGTAGVTYELLCSAVTSTGQTLQLSGYLSIIPDLM